MSIERINPFMQTYAPAPVNFGSSQPISGDPKRIEPQFGGTARPLAEKYGSAEMPTFNHVDPRVSRLETGALGEEGAVSVPGGKAGISLNCFA